MSENVGKVYLLIITVLDDSLDFSHIHPLMVEYSSLMYLMTLTLTVVKGSNEFYAC